MLSNAKKRITDKHEILTIKRFYNTDTCTVGESAWVLLETQSWWVKVTSCVHTHSTRSLSLCSYLIWMRFCLPLGEEYLHRLFPCLVLGSLPFRWLSLCTLT